MKGQAWSSVREMQVGDEVSELAGAPKQPPGSPSGQSRSCESTARYSCFRDYKSVAKREKGSGCPELTVEAYR